MECRECGAEMIIYDDDFNSNGNFVQFWECFLCSTSCVLKFRFSDPWEKGELLKEIWHSEHNDNIKDYVINHIKHLHKHKL